jgi:hypothetical protein
MLPAVHHFGQFSDGREYGLLGRGLWVLQPDH